MTSSTKGIKPSPQKSNKAGKVRRTDHAEQQTSLSSFFTGSTGRPGAKAGSTIQTKTSSKGKAENKETGARQDGVISIDDSSEEEAGIVSAKHQHEDKPYPGIMNPNGKSDGDALKQQHFITVDSSSESEQDVKPHSAGPTKKRARPTTPPKPSISSSTPSTPSRMLKLTAPLNPSPSKRQKREAEAGSENDIEPKVSVGFEKNLAPPATTSSLGTISASGSTSVDHTVYDFDTDPFTFRPEDVNVSFWPRGKLPYSVLVGVYVQVGGTRSRLAIVRIISK